MDRREKKNQRSFGGAQTPIHGPACLWCAPAKSSFYLLIAPLQPVLEKGMTIETYEKYLDSPSGQTFLKDFSIVVRIDLVKLLFAPAGWLVHFVEYQECGPKDETEIVAGMHMPLGGGFNASLHTRVREAFK